jgi:hypothetical protein
MTARGTEMDTREALRIVLDLAAQNALDKEQVEENPDLADEMKRQQEALNIVSDHIGEED